ncbi:DUF4837 family protein [Cesiribacter andamanensis]|uniref:DUF4837 domain-containing protein n=1 Tax=Cesiribacter andamanensis AMV16 TaxID=1279009 RepID=M7N7F6_9BACT|nr:DUF4837 family protein [Cesiribacter andamanensis]EMR04543.1 hypothetical protein ADICEAN_00301 [Cesiribacter andamanensis AMV16]
MNLKTYSICLLPLLLLITACGGNSNSQDNRNQDKDFLPRASLVPYELLVVMDSAQWRGVLGEAIRDVFTEPVQGLPQEEPHFKVRYITPQGLKGFNKRYPNILFAFTLDKRSQASEMLRSMFSEQSLEQIRQDEQRYRLSRKDEFARGQEVMYLFGQTEDQLVSRIYTNKENLLNHFLTVERQRYMRDYANVRVTQSLSNSLASEYGFKMNFPAGYQVAKQDTNFVWIRLLDNKVDKSVWVTWKPYTDQSIFQRDNLMNYRNQVVRNYIWGSDSSTYMRLETQLPVEVRQVNFNGRYGVEARGLWRLEKMVMGGPFLGYAFVDEATNRVYYIEGFTYAPGQDKRLAMSELEAILWSFTKTAPKNIQ